MNDQLYSYNLTFHPTWKINNPKWVDLSLMDDQITYDNNKIINSQFFSFIGHP
jgi:hypothetical protein